MAGMSRADALAVVGKKDKPDAGYGPGGKHCHACRYFSEGSSEKMTPEGEPGQCEKVAGVIGGHMVCKLFEWDMKPPEYNG